MKEFFLNHICTAPPYTTASCEYQYILFTTVGLAILIGGVITLAAILIYQRKNGPL